jgi:predicted RNA binding protein YcfA (HicA-like mRNA interferase family)
VVEGFYKTIAKLLRQSGFARVPGGKGSHEKWVNATGLTLTVPRNL